MEEKGSVKNVTIGTVNKCYGLTPATIKYIADYARKNECSQSQALRSLIRIAMNVLEN